MKSQSEDGPDEPRWRDACRRSGTGTRSSRSSYRFLAACRRATPDGPDRDKRIAASNTGRSWPDCRARTRSSDCLRSICSIGSKWRCLCGRFAMTSVGSTASSASPADDPGCVLLSPLAGTITGPSLVVDEATFGCSLGGLDSLSPRLLGSARLPADAACGKRWCPPRHPHPLQDGSSHTACRARQA